MDKSRPEVQLFATDGIDMRPDISEFSFGFAVTSELIGLAPPIKAAPYFPSLIEEGKEGGGYDVKLEFASIELYLQFKRSDCMLRKTAKELKVPTCKLEVPFYRFHITETTASYQHTMLLELDKGEKQVFYVAPRFHKLEEINKAWLAHTVGAQSIFVRPRDIGALDEKPHHVAFDAGGQYRCSQPQAISAFSIVQVRESILSQLSKQEEPLGEKLPRLLEEGNAAFHDGLEKLRARRKSSRRQQSLFKEFIGQADKPTVSPLPEDPSVSPARRLLSKLAIQAATKFGSQLVIVQKKVD